MEYVYIVLQIVTNNIGETLVSLGKTINEAYRDYADYVSVESVDFIDCDLSQHSGKLKVRLNVPIHQSRGLIEVVRDMMNCDFDITTIIDMGKES